MINRIVRLTENHIVFLKKLISNDKVKFAQLESPIHDEIFKLLNEAELDTQAYEHVPTFECDDSGTESDDDDDDDIYTIQDFVELVKSGCFIDDDGIGEYANYNPVNQDDKQIIKSGNKISPSDATLETNYTHVVWYNK